MKQTSSVNRHQSQKQDDENTEGIKKSCQQKCRVLRKELENVKKKKKRSKENYKTHLPRQKLN